MNFSKQLNGMNFSKQQNANGNIPPPINLNEPASKSLSSLMEMNNTVNNSINQESIQPSFKPTSYSSIASMAHYNGTSSYIQYGLIIIIISLLGLNVFGFLENITEKLAELIRPIASFFGYSVGETIKTTLSTSASGTKGIIDVATGTITGGVDILEKGLTYKNKQNRNKIDNSFLDQSVPNITKPEEIPEPDDSGSRTQSKSTGKSGYCYIGEDRGFRNCIEVGENDNCMSGDIFPSQEICINPNLRE
jgi:hypothetical protein